MNDKNKDLFVERPSDSSRYNLNTIKFKGEDEIKDIQQKDLKNKVVKIDLGTEYFKANEKTYPSGKQIFDGLMKEMRQEQINSKLKEKETTK